VFVVCDVSNHLLLLSMCNNDVFSKKRKEGKERSKRKQAFDLKMKISGDIANVPEELELFRLDKIRKAQVEEFIKLFIYLLFQTLNKITNVVGTPDVRRAVVHNNDEEEMDDDDDENSIDSYVFIYYYNL
jgi:hypothetical protein